MDTLFDVGWSETKPHADGCFSSGHLGRFEVAKLPEQPCSWYRHDILCIKYTRAYEACFDTHLESRRARACGMSGGGHKGPLLLFIGDAEDQAWTHFGCKPKIN